MRWDVFCRVVDNLGDAGVCWRLARQLAAEHGLRVTLWIDDPVALARLAPGVAGELPVQRVGGVRIVRWNDRPEWPGEAADVVVEAFGCDPPPAYIAAMAARRPVPVWINLDHLSAEGWVEGCHRLPSPHPRLPLVKHFFYPGFAAATGGLLRERELLPVRDAFMADPQGAAGFMARLGVPPPAPGGLRISLFAYRASPVTPLLAAWRAGGRPIQCLVPDDQIELDTAAHRRAGCGSSDAVDGMLDLRPVPFLSQDDYDRLLWACDCNFVRGEDSFVRAQWAGRPMVWQIYPQRDDAHQPKLDAFLARYCEGLPADPAQAVTRLWRAWNGRGDVAEAWSAFADALPPLAGHARAWSGKIATLGDLAGNLVQFCESRL